MDRYWLLTWTTYGTWLTGDARGFVSPINTDRGVSEIHNIPGTDYDRDQHPLMEWAHGKLKCPPISLVLAQAECLFGQFQETAKHRGWQLLAVAVMATHVHLVVGVPEDPKPESILRDFKAYGSRALNRRWKVPASETWWTESGSKRKLPDESAILAAVRYVMNQANPLVLWVAEGLDV